jgi:TolA-binding protein
VVSKRLTKQEIREDRVMTAATQAVTFARNNARWVVAAAAVMIVAVVAAVVIAQGRVRAEREAGLAMFQAQNLYFSGSFDQAAAQFQALADRYGSARSARQARLFEGNSQLQAGNAAAAEQAFRKFLGAGSKDPVSEAAARRGVGGALAGEEKFAEASEEFAKAAELAGNPLAAEDWLEAGRFAARAGKNDEAARSFEKLLDLYPQNPAAGEARIRLQEAAAH